MQQEVITQPPGVYVIFCAMNTEDGREHFQLGMYRTIRIVKQHRCWPGDPRGRPAMPLPPKPKLVARQVAGTTAHAHSQDHPSLRSFRAEQPCPTTRGQRARPAAGAALLPTTCAVVGRTVDSCAAHPHVVTKPGLAIALTTTTADDLDRGPDAGVLRT
jgi:hypothetical protein